MIQDFLRVENLGKYQNGSNLLGNITFSQQQFQKIAIAGETGSGKSTLLKIVAGLVQATAGRVYLHSEPVLGPEEKLMPGHKRIAYLSQHFELRNNYRVEEILSYANKLPGEEAGELFSICRIDHLLKRRTDQLSGGEKQRIALARLLITSPTLLLLDEPYSNLDIIHKGILRTVVDEVSEKLGITCILISHDPLDILSWADHVIVMKNGSIVQQDTPLTVYTRPVNEYAAALFGKYNLVNLNGRPVFCRPEDLLLSTNSEADIAGVVKSVNFYGNFYEIQVATPNQHLLAHSRSGNIAVGQTVGVNITSNHSWQLL